MNDFKKKLTLYGRVEAVRLIMAFLNRKLTKEDEEKLLAIEEENIPDSMFILLFQMAKEYIKTGEIKEENLKMKAKELSLSQVKDEWKKDPKEWGKKERKENAR